MKMVTIELNAEVVDMLDRYKEQRLAWFGKMADKETSPILKKMWITRMDEFENADYEFLATDYLKISALKEIQERGESDE